MGRWITSQLAGTAEFLKTEGPAGTAGEVTQIRALIDNIPPRSHAQTAHSAALPCLGHELAASAETAVAPLVTPFRPARGPAGACSARARLLRSSGRTRWESDRSAS